jgi:hypothetical protein
MLPDYIPRVPFADKAISSCSFLICGGVYEEETTW